MQSNNSTKFKGNKQAVADSDQNLSSARENKFEIKNLLYK